MSQNEKKRTRRNAYSSKKVVRRSPSCRTGDDGLVIYEKRRYATMVKMRHDLALLDSNNSVVYGHKVLVLVFLVRTRETF